MAQALYEANDLPQGALEASAAFHRDHLSPVRDMAAKSEALVVLLQHAPHDHADWRRALARDLARAHAPKRVNVIAASDEAAKDALLAYLRDAPGVTGQYLQTHE